MTGRTEFEEIAHTGGQVTFTVSTDPEGQRTYQIGYRHSRPNRMAMFAIYAIPQGVAVGDIDIAGMGVPWNPPPIPGCFPVFIASDSEGMFGRQCPICDGYWRCSHKAMICPYCGEKVEHFYQSLTDAQRDYVHRCCQMLEDVLYAAQDGVHTIDMDAVADAVGEDRDLPPFYYAEERQQTVFTCHECGGVSDILGKYSYCSRCGTRNDTQHLMDNLDEVRQRVNTGGPPEAAVRDAVSGFDSFATQLAAQLMRRVPLTRERRAQLERVRFHDLQRTRQIFDSFFGINVLKGLTDDDVSFLTLMFHRRHVYEHKGGEADEKYIAESGDSVRPKQALRETVESAHRTVSLVRKIADNLHSGFHDIFPPLEAPIADFQRRKAVMGRPAKGTIRTGDGGA